MKRIGQGSRISGGHAGFTAVELLAAVLVVSLGLIAVGAGIATAIQGAETGRQQATATLVAEQRMEQIRGAARGRSTAACTGFANITTACFPAQGYNTIVTAPGYRSIVTVTDYVVNGAVGSKRVEVEVFYQPIVAWGVSLPVERSVRLSTLVTNRT